MVVFKSLIVLDAETTSLPELDHNTTRITELAFIGCEVEHLKQSQELPRVLHKLVMLFNPNKLIQPKASVVSGLTNEALANLQPFRREDVDIIRNFISRLPPPVCIIAHNGYNFDFPILRRALTKLEKDIQNNVYCVDSLEAFASLLPGVKRPLWTRRPKAVPSTTVTPTHQNAQPVNSLNYTKVARVLFPEEESLIKKTPNQDDHNKVTSYSSSRISFPDEEILGEKTSDAYSSRVTSYSTPRSYKLKDLYYYYQGEYLKNAHRAEEDAKALLSCIRKCKGFFDWMNENAVVFNSVQPLF